MIECVCGKKLKSRRSIGVHKRYCEKIKEFEEKEKKWLQHQYTNLQKSTYQIASESNYSKSTIYELLKKYNIKTRNKSNAQLGEKNHMSGKIMGKSPVFKGENAGINAKHEWIKSHNEKPENCEKCGKKTEVELSFNHSLGDYTRNIDDYEWLCHSCHLGKDRGGLK
jgi:hypothetical protein